MLYKDKRNIVKSIKQMYLLPNSFPGRHIFPLYQRTFGRAGAGTAASFACGGYRLACFHALIDVLATRGTGELLLTAGSRAGEQESGGSAKRDCAVRRGRAERCSGSCCGARRECLVPSIVVVHGVRCADAAESDPARGGNRLHRAWRPSVARL